MKKPYQILAALGTLACLSLPARADISAEGVVLEPHDGGPRVCVILRHLDHNAADNFSHSIAYVSLYARSGPDDGWHIVRQWNEPSESNHGPHFTESILTENSHVLRDMKDKPWQAKVVIENPLQPADQRIFTPTWDTATR